MSTEFHLPALRHLPDTGISRSSRIDAGIVIRVACAALALIAALVAFPALASERLGLRGDITTTSDVITLGEIISGAPQDMASIPVFRAPALGEQGTIQSSRIIATVESLGLGNVETYGRTQINVMRAARRIGADEISSALATEIGNRFALDAATLSVNFDGPSPSLVVAPDVIDPVRVIDLSYNPDSRRLSGIVFIGPNTAERRAQVMVSGAVIETVEIGILNRAIARGEAIRASDVGIERRPRETIPADARMDNIAIEGHVARRPLAAGAALRQGDLLRPDLVARGENVLIIYRSRGLTLTMRGAANEAGVLGDVINVTNPQSKRTLQATVAGPGQVVVNAPSLGPIASTGRIQ
jgi:flagella basal body P-ring formation protein FlgA